MKANKNDKLKSLIQQTGLDHPIPDFTAMVMKDISAEYAPEELISPALKSLLQQHAIESLPADFTARVMLEIQELQKEVVFKPIISHKAWLIAVTAIAAFFILAPKGHGEATSRPYLGMQLLQDGLKHIQLNGNTSLYFTVLIMISVLLGSDYLIRYYGSRHKHDTL